MDSKIINEVTYLRESNNPILVYSDSEIKDQSLSGKLWMNNLITKKSIKVVEENGDYDKIKSLYHNDIAYILFTKYENGCRDLYIKALKEEEVLYKKCIAYNYKIDNFDAVFHDDKIIIATERYIDTYVNIYIFMLDCINGDCIKEFYVAKHERAYKPVLLSNNDALYLAYESFYAERYHINIRIMDKGRSNFTNAVEVGFDCLNDQSPDLFALEDEIYLSFENSSPLFTDYIWEPPNKNLPTVYIPSFGHGWRVFNKMCIRKLKYKSNILEVYCINDENMWSSSLKLDTNDAAGEISSFILNSTLFVIFVEYDGNKNYKTVVKYFDKEGFRSVETEKILYYERKRPIFIVIDNIIYITVDNPYEKPKHYCIDLSEINGSIPEFRKVKEVKLNKLNATPKYVPSEINKAKIGNQNYNPELFTGLI